MPLLSVVQRKAPAEKQPQSKSRTQMNSQQGDSLSPMDFELDEPPQPTDTIQQRPKRLKRPTKSVNENIEPAFTPPS